MVYEQHRRFMLHAIHLAKKAKGKTFPNPLVGAIVVKNGQIVGEGYHKRPGMPHAEIIALRNAQRNPKAMSLIGASLYVNLEPCAHYGRTPPCVNSIIASGIKIVYVAMKDPNPLVNGKGIDFLCKNGIYVDVGICRQEAEKLNASYIERMSASLDKKKKERQSAREKAGRKRVLTCLRD